MDLRNFTKDTNVADLWELYKVILNEISFHIHIPQIKIHFVSFDLFDQTTYRKNYGSDEESAKRFDIFAANVKKITEHNELYDKGESSYKMGLNEYADFTAEEFREFRFGPLMGLG